MTLKRKWEDPADGRRAFVESMMVPVSEASETSETESDSEEVGRSSGSGSACNRLPMNYRSTIMVDLGGFEVFLFFLEN